jgi:CRISPR/Cas system endoribonuclease Cas6 (RAMP superfamily)
MGRARGTAVLRAFEPQPLLQFPLCGAERTGRVTIHFVTPTELKSRGSVIEEPGFAVLIERLAERVATLGRLYQHWPPWDYRDLLERSRAVRLIDWNWEYEHRERRSSRTGERHPVGGFTGSAIYEGPIGVFLPLLEIGRWTGVGRQTVWGKGEIRVKSLQLQ